MSYPRLVSWSYFDGKGIFSGKNEKEQLTKVYILKEEGEQLLKGGKIVRLNMFKGYHDPYFKIVKTEGFTRRAKNYGKLKSKMLKEYPELERKLTGVSSLIMDYGEYVYIDLPHLDNYVNPLTKDKETFLNENFIYKENFTPDFVKTLIEFRPRALMGGVIESYRKDDIPKFLSELKLTYPEIYQEVISTSNIAKSLVEEISYIGKKAYVKTLSNGEVEIELNILDKQKFYWDGKTLTNKLEMSDGNILSQSITPNENTIVKIVSDSTVNENTKLAN